MRIIIILLVFILSANAQKSFSPEYFIKKHNLRIPKITKEMLNILKHTHASDSWFYFYPDNDDRVDSVYNYRNIQGFDPIHHYDKYSYRRDSVFIRGISIVEPDLDTTTNKIIIFTDNFRTKYAHNSVGRSYKYFNKLTPWGKLAMEKWQYPGDKEPHGRDFKLIKHDDYIESIEVDEGKIDSTDRRYYYFTPFDSLIAECIVENGKEPVIISLRNFNVYKNLQNEYQFNFYGHTCVPDRIIYKTYTKTGRLNREYFFSIKNRKAEKKEYTLTNYTQFTYDKRGRKKRMITYVVPDKE